MSDDFGVNYYKIILIYEPNTSHLAYECIRLPKIKLVKTDLDSTEFIYNYGAIKIL